MTARVTPPFSGPAWVTSGRILVVSMALSCTAFLLFDSGRLIDTAPLALCMLVVAVLTARSRRPEIGLVVSGLCGGVMLGPLVIGLVGAVASWHPIGAVLSLPGLVLGFVFVGPACGALAVPIAYDMRTGAYDATDRSLFRAGLWLVATNLVLSGSHREPWPLLPAVNVALGTAFVVAAIARRSMRRAWYRRVRRGTVPGWSLVAATTGLAPLDLPALFAREASALRELGPGAPLGVLVYTHTTAGAYRFFATPVAFTLVKP